MTISADTFGCMLTETIVSGNANKTMLMLMKLTELVSSDDTIADWVTHPPVIKQLHELLIEHLGVGQKMLMIKNKVPNRKKRAILFVQAMQHAVRKTLHE